MKLIFAGTPEFARLALAQLHQAGHQITLVLTQPDRPAGRGQKEQASPVKQFALAHGLPVAQPMGLRLDGKFAADAAAAQQHILAAQADAMVVAAYGLILPQWVLDLMGQGTGLGCFNIHASLLPRWRGAAPIQRAIEAGDAQTGVTIMQMDAGLDTGDVLLEHSLPISPHDTAASLHDRLAALGSALMVQALELAARGALHAQPQATQGITYARKIEKTEAALDWTHSAAQLERRIRAFDPFPGATTQLGGDTLKIWSAQVEPQATGLDAGTAPGTVLAPLEGSTGAVRVACGQGVLQLTQLQRPGGKRLPATAFLRGFALAPGQRLAAAQSAPAKPN